MVDKRRDIITDRQLLSIILEEIWSKEEVMESNLYPLVGARSRVRPMLEELGRYGILNIREKDSGHRAKLYSYTDKGRMFCLANRLMDDLMAEEGTIDFESGRYSDLYDGLRRHYLVKYGGSSAADYEEEMKGSGDEPRD